MTAARTGKAKTVKLLLAHGANVNAQEKLARTDRPDVGRRRKQRDGRADARRSRRRPRRRARMAASRRCCSRSAPAATRRVARAARQRRRRQRRIQGALPAAQGRPHVRRRARGRAATPPGTAGANNGVEQLLQVFNTGSRRGAGPQGTSALVLAIMNAHFELAGAAARSRRRPERRRPGVDGAPSDRLDAASRRSQHGLPPPVPTGTIDSLELAEKLLENGANPNARMTKEPADGARNILNRIGSTPFLQAAKLGDIPYMQLLLDVRRRSVNHDRRKARRR